MKYSFFIFIFLVAISSCGVLRKSSKNNSPLRDAQKTSRYGDSLLRKNWEYFSSRVEIDYSTADQELSGTVNLRMRKDSIIWFSVSAIMGIQVAKGIITKDSVKILDLYNKKYIRYEISRLSQSFGAEIGLRELQNLIIGNPVFDTLTYNIDATKTWYAVQQPLTNMIYCRDFSLPDSSHILQKGSLRELRTAYQGARSAGGFDISEKMFIQAKGDAKNVRLGIEFTTASDAFIPSYPFSVPDGFEISE